MNQNDSGNHVDPSKSSGSSPPDKELSLEGLTHLQEFILDCYLNEEEIRALDREKAKRMDAALTQAPGRAGPPPPTQGRA